MMACMATGPLRRHEAAATTQPRHHARKAPGHPPALPRLGTQVTNDDGFKCGGPGRLLDCARLVAAAPSGVAATKPTASLCLSRCPSKGAIDLEEGVASHHG